MESNSKAQSALVQLQLACMEVAHGCEMASLRPVKSEDMELLLMALLEMAGTAEKLRDAIKKDERRKINPTLDHDGDTQPPSEK
jgi:hypothetical protein